MLTILYRGPLNSCNYGCSYCPFAKRKVSRPVLQSDAERLDRFLDWCENAQERLSIFFTPWGEALIHHNYRTAIARLAALSHVDQVAIQTNLSCSVAWMAALPRAKVGFWCTFHPGETPESVFVEKCRWMSANGVRFSVGAVGKPEHLQNLCELRSVLPEHTYFWINALRGTKARRLSSDEAAAFAELDSLFELNLAGAKSFGRDCDAGWRTIAVDGDGNATRCHFTPGRIGNLYSPDFLEMLKPRTCTARMCRCHIGYSHMPELRFSELFGDGLLARAPQVLPKPEAMRARLPLMRAPARTN